MEASFESLGFLKQDLKRRLKTPIKSVTFYAHLFLAVLAGGGAGIWYTMYQDGFAMEKLAAALLTYFPALVAAAVIDFTHEEQPYLRSFGLLSGLVFFVIFMAAITRASTSHWQFFWAFVGTVFAILFWWFANGEKPCFKDVVAINAAGGETVNRPLPGNTKGWNVHK
jgi:hypothetical protein